MSRNYDLPESITNNFDHQFGHPKRQDEYNAGQVIHNFKVEERKISLDPEKQQRI